MIFSKLALKLGEGKQDQEKVTSTKKENWCSILTSFIILIYTNVKDCMHVLLLIFVDFITLGVYVYAL